jgi:hypothetical protein
VRGGQHNKGEQTPMIVNFETMTPITTVPHRKDFDYWCSKLTPTQIAEIKAAINAKINGTEIQTSSWMPGRDRTGNAYQPIYEKAANYRERNAAMCFGLFVWQVFMERPETWFVGRFEKDGELIAGIFSIPRIGLQVCGSS